MTRKRILIADDSLEVAETLADVLTHLDYEVVLVNDGTEAIKRAAGEHFDLVLLDVHMPGIGGIEALREIQQQHAKMPILLMTAAAEEVLANEVENVEDVEVFGKPVDLSFLLDQIQQLTEASQPRRRLLVVDDDAQITRMFVRRFTRYDYEVDTAETGQEALGLVKHHRYDAVFVDICLPDINGLALYTQLKCIQPHVVGVLMTGFGGEPAIHQLLRQARRSGYICLEKPFLLDEALDLIRRERSPRRCGEP